MAKSKQKSYYEYDDKLDFDDDFRDEPVPKVSRTKRIQALAKRKRTRNEVRSRIEDYNDRKAIKKRVRFFDEDDY